MKQNTPRSLFGLVVLALLISACGIAAPASQPDPEPAPPQPTNTATPAPTDTPIPTKTEKKKPLTGLWQPLLR